MTLHEQSGLKQFLCQGEWLNGWRHGIGKHVYPDGRIYEGNFSENWYHGDGEWTWPDGHVFRGVFKEHCPTTGTLIHADGGVEEVDFDGKTFIWSDSLEMKRKHKVSDLIPLWIARFVSWC